ncbi:MAG: hypothetical protein WCI71_09525, partial [Bacteroidota bacterium]
MEQQVITSFYTQTQHLVSNEILSLNYGSQTAFYLETGEADIFYVEKLPTGPGRRLFLFRISGPFLIPCFKDTNSLSLVICVLTNCTIGILDSGSMEKLIKSKPDYAICLIDNWFVKVSAGLNNFGTMPLLNGLIATPAFSADPLKNYGASN